MVDILEVKEIISKRKAFLFDFDGTLANLDKLNVDSFNILFKDEFDIDFSKEDFMNHISGRGSRDGITKYLTLKGITDYQIDELSERFNDIKRGLIMEKLEDEVYIIPGLENFLTYLKGSSKRILVVTSSHYEYVKHILEHFNLFSYFEKVYDRTSVINGKPNPDIFLNAIENTGLDSNECIAFEDSLFGLQSSKSAGLFTVGILNTGWNDGFVYDLADIVISSYDELI